MTQLEVGHSIGPYRLESVIGQGGMGVVYRAVRKPDGATVALKVLRSELGDSDVYLKRFAREGRIAREVEHDHLVPVLESGEAAGVHYLAARYVDGRSLAERLADDGPLPVTDLVILVAEIADALDALHRRGLVHRDVKPSNILIDGDGKAALTDFGLARGTADSVLTTPGRVVGTLDYLAPEVIRGESATPAADVYALGCVAFECLAGRPPFGHLPFADAAVAHLQQEPEDPAAGRDDVAAELGWAAGLALAKSPADRPATAVAYARLLAVAARPRA